MENSVLDLTIEKTAPGIKIQKALIVLILSLLGSFSISLIFEICPHWIVPFTYIFIGAFFSFLLFRIWKARIKENISDPAIFLITPLIGLLSYFLIDFYVFFRMEILTGTYYDRNYFAMIYYYSRFAALWYLGSLFFILRFYNYNKNKYPQ